MLLEELAYDLPEALVSAYPAADRVSARLMVVERATGTITHSTFASLGEFLWPGDLLVLNDSRVIPARLEGRKDSGGRAEVLLVEPFDTEAGLWLALVDASKRPRVGGRIEFSMGVAATVLGDLGAGRYGLRFEPAGRFREVLDELGTAPLPHYIQRVRRVEESDRESYQTVYAATPGSVAAPTAGLHFTRALLDELAAGGVDSVYVTLHVGLGTFRPVRETVVENHRMDGEWYTLTASAAERIRRVRATGNRVVAVGSTSTRTLESIVQRKGGVVADSGITRLFITGGYRFRGIDALITNFHLPRSTPLAMVAALAGLDLVRRAYAEAIDEGYRFYSYGDAMLIL
ncbi:MAG: tRNA preQ1(34) S-adenosylmethionine ribosyltransferase-isomerase QueA [Deltaproteobacteria bacterium]|nr:tRNA preQ1(34) S-adenosylmethionine ribosyltransferase-isomerase QueA [Deltaproteobacteria bacterium]